VFVLEDGSKTAIISQTGISQTGMARALGLSPRGKALRRHLGQLLGIAQVSADKLEYEKHVGRIFGVQHEMDV
jgi:hypothetical protein